MFGLLIWVEGQQVAAYGFEPHAQWCSSSSWVTHAGMLGFMLWCFDVLQEKLSLHVAYPLSVGWKSVKPFGKVP